MDATDGSRDVEQWWARFASDAALVLHVREQIEGAIPALIEDPFGANGAPRVARIVASAQFELASSAVERLGEDAQDVDLAHGVEGRGAA